MANHGTITDAQERFRSKSHKSSLVRLILSWLIVLIPLAWGVSETVTKALALFY